MQTLLIIEMSGTKDNQFLFVIWSAARNWMPQIEAAVGRKFKVVRSFDVQWEKKHFAQNLASFYGWKSWHVWWTKARKCGTGPFRVIVVEDPAPVWKRERDTFGHEMLVDENIYSLKKSFRALTGRSNVIHSSVTVEETEHQLAALDSPCSSPIPFRRMEYGDDERIRACRRRVWLGLLYDVLVPVLLSFAVGAFVWVDMSIFNTGCADGGFVEWSGFLLSAICGALMTFCAVRMKSGRGAYALFAALFFDLAVRELDHIFDKIFVANVWPWVLTAITLTFAMLTVRYAKSVHSGIRSIRRSRSFLLFTCGLSLIILVSQMLGLVRIWQSLGIQDALRLGQFLEESVELFGYFLMFVWAASHTLRVIRRGH